MKILLSLALLATFAFANNGVEGRVTTLENQLLNTTTQMNTLEQTVNTSSDSTDIAALQSSTNDLYNELMSSNSALSSVELNPDHEGFSIGLGLSAYHGETSGALGIMYALPTDANGVTLGINLKGYRTEGGGGGASGGITLGF